MLDCPPPLRSWRGLLGWLNTLRAYVLQSTPLPTPSCNVITGPNGSLIDPVPVGAIAVAAADSYPFEVYRSQFLGTGTPPANQALRVRVRPAFVQPWGSLGPQFSANMNEELILPDNKATYYVWIETTIESSGESISLVEFRFAHGETTPAPIINSADPDNVFPSQYCIPLSLLKTEGGAIVSIDPLVKSSLSLSLVVIGITCGGQERSVFWSAL